MKEHQKPFTKTNKVIDTGTRSKALNGVKPVKNINKNSEFFFKINPVQKEGPPLHKLQDHAYE